MVTLINKMDFPALNDGDTVTMANSGGDAADTAFNAFNSTPTKKVPGLFGAGCMHVALPNVIVQYMGWNKTAGSGLGSFTFAECWASQYINYGSARSPDTRIRSMAILNGINGQIITTSYTTGGVIQVRNISNGASTTGSVALSLNTWYRVEMHANIVTTGNLSIDVWVYDAATETLVDSILGNSQTVSGLVQFGGAWYGCMNTASVNFPTGWDIDVVRFSTDGLIGPYTPPSHAPYWGTPVV